MVWQSAKLRLKTLAHGQCGLTDNSKAGDWRLPNIVELEAIYSAKSQFKAVQAYYYWSSSTYAGNSSNACYVNLFYGNVFNINKDVNDYVWPVRGGQ